MDFCSMYPISKLLLLLLLIATVPVTALGQKAYEGPGNWFVGIDAGAAFAMNENVTGDNLFKVRMPSGSIVLGRMFNPYWGLRLSAGVYSQLGHPYKKAVLYDPEMFSDYLFYAGSGSLDVMLNLANLCRKYDVRNWFDAYLIAGGGMLYTFGMDKKVDEWPDYMYPVNSQNLWCWNAKVGFMGAWHMNRACDFTAELDVFMTENAYNGVADDVNKVDLFMSFRVGVVYYFTNSKGRHRYANPPKRKYWKF